MRNRTLDERLVVIVMTTCLAILVTLVVALLTHHIVVGLALAAVIRFAATIARWQILR